MKPIDLETTVGRSDTIIRSAKYSGTIFFEALGSTRFIPKMHTEITTNGHVENSHELCPQRRDGCQT